MRINRRLAIEGYATRRDADKLIEQGKVFINGRKAVLGDQVEDNDTVEVRMTGQLSKSSGMEKKPSLAKPQHIYVIYNKPAGVTTLDKAGATLFDTLDVPEAHGARLFPIGRLDKDARGLMLFTTDGRVTDRLLNPAKEQPRTYEVTINDHYSPSLLNSFKVVLSADAERISDRSFRVTLTRGAQDIKTLCGRYHFEVVDMLRTSMGPLKLGGLTEGNHRILKGTELAAFTTALGLKAIDKPTDKAPRSLK